MLIKKINPCGIINPTKRLIKNSAVQFAKTEKAKIILRRNHVNEKQIKPK